jgi:MFS family permease
MVQVNRPPHVLPAIVLSQFAGTSLWFAGNAVAEDLGLGTNAAYAASAVQVGFILGTLISVRLRLADRYSAPFLFFLCCCAGAIFNYPLTALVRLSNDYAGIGVIAMRFAVGLSLAGIYPIGIKVAAGWYQNGLGRALGYLTGALVLGTAFPHLVRGLGTDVSWHIVLGTASAIALAGGILMLFGVAEGPYARRQTLPQRGSLAQAWRLPRLRASATGYFGHMWELYAFWAFVPFFLNARMATSAMPTGDASLWLFAIIAGGALGCVGGGLFSHRHGSAKVAFAQLSVSGACCLLSPVAYLLPHGLFLAFLILWGIAVVGDSPQFSALNALEAPPAQVGSLVTMVNCIGFAITIVSIQLLGQLTTMTAARYIMWPLALGPVLGLIVFGRAYFFSVVVSDDAPKI